MLAALPCWDVVCFGYSPTLAVAMLYVLVIVPHCPPKEVRAEKGAFCHGGAKALKLLCHNSAKPRRLLNPPEELRLQSFMAASRLEDDHCDGSLREVTGTGHRASPQSQTHVLQ